MKEISKKVVIAGRTQVGKSSILNRLALDEFNEQPNDSIGVRIERLENEVSGKLINMVLWDLAGDSTNPDTPNSYFLGANIIVYVVDLNSPETYSALTADLRSLSERAGDLPVVTVANKSDLLTPSQIENALKSFSEQPDIICSSKTGAGLDKLHEKLLSISLSYD